MGDYDKELEKKTLVEQYEYVFLSLLLISARILTLGKLPSVHQPAEKENEKEKEKEKEKGVKPAKEPSSFVSSSPENSDGLFSFSCFV